MAESDSDLKDAVQEVVNMLREVDGLRRVPDEPPENNDQFPFVIVYPGDGRYKGGPPGLVTGLHNIVIELHIARKDLPRDFSSAMVLFDRIPFKLFANLKAKKFSTIRTFSDIEYEFGPLNYAGIDTLGPTYTMTEVKIQTTL